MGDNMTLRRRLERLEKRGGGCAGPFVALYRLMRLGDEHGLAFIGAGPYGEAGMLRRKEDETEAAFLDRLEAEVTRIHGRLPPDWTGEGNFNDLAAKARPAGSPARRDQ